MQSNFFRHGHAALHRWLAVAVVSILLAACQPVPSAPPDAAATVPPATVPPAAATIPEVLIEVDDTAFSVPADFPGGIVAVTVQNNSSQDLDIGFARVLEGTSIEELMVLADDFMGNLVPISQMASFMYSFNPIPVGESGRVFMDFRTGTFMVDATAHAEAEPIAGAPRIYATFSADTVVGTIEPQATVQVDMADFALVMPDEIPTGKQLWHFVNTGQQWHMMFLVQPVGDANVQAVTAALMEEGAPDGPPPFEFVQFGAPPISAGEQVWVEFELAPGSYVAACPLPDLAAIMAGEMPESHIQHGMHRVLTVTGQELAAASPANTLPEVTITAQDFAFEMPAEIPAGLVSITFANEGAVNHHGLVMRLLEGMTLDQVTAALAEGEESGGPELYDLAFFLPDTDPGKRNQVTVDMPPGNWLIASFSMDATGGDGPPLPDWARGSIQLFTVTDTPQSAATPEAAPEADVVITIGADDFDAPGELPAGEHTIQVVNSSEVDNAYAFIISLGGNTTMEDVLAAFEVMFTGGELEEIPIFSSVGGLMSYNLSETYYTTIDFAPGNYAIITNIGGNAFPYSGLYKTLTVE